MSKHLPVSNTRWQESQKHILLSWQKRNLESERQQAERSLLPLLQRYAKRYPDDASILEIGCGPLCLCRSLAHKCITYLDPMVDDFRRLFPGELPEEGEYLATTAERISKPNASYDIITCLNTIPHTLNPELIMNEIERLLKPEGRLILAILTHNSLEARLHYLAVNTFPHLYCKTRPYYYSLTGIQRTLQRHFHIEDIIVHQSHAIPVPFCSRKQHIFICSRKSPQNSPLIGDESPSTPIL